MHEGAFYVSGPELAHATQVHIPLIKIQAHGLNQLQDVVQSYAQKKSRALVFVNTLKLYNRCPYPVSLLMLWEPHC